MYTQPTYNPTLANLTSSEFERLTYAALHPFDLVGAHTLVALHDVEQAHAVRDVIENYNLDFDDPKELDRDIERLVERDALADERKYALGELTLAVENALQILQQPAKRGSEYAKAAMAELEAALSSAGRP